MHGWWQLLLPCLWYLCLFQLPTISFTPPLQLIKGTTPSENWHDLSTACCRKLRRRHPCPLWTKGKGTLSLIIRGSQQLMKRTFSPVLVWWLRWAKLVAITYRQNFVVMPVAFSKSLWIVSCQLWLRDPSLDRVWAVSALKFLLVGMTSLLSIFLTSSWMASWRRVGPGGAKLRRAGPSTSPLCKNSGIWSGRPRGSALT